MSGENAHVLLAVEAESYVEHLQKYKLVDVGSPSWGRQHEMIEKLNMQAVLNASAQEDEYIKDFLISYNKTECLIYDLIVTEVWKQKIFKELVEMEFEPKTTFPIYMVLYHEATVINLLETTLFFRETCESAEDSIPDLIDYCYRKLTELVARSAEAEDDDEDDEINKEVSSSTFTATNMEDLEKQEKTLNFEICIKAVSVLRYITDNLGSKKEMNHSKILIVSEFPLDGTKKSLPLSAVTRILNTHDIPILLVQLVESPPWTKTKDGKIYKFIDTKWQEVNRADSLKITKIEGQVWLTLFHLLMDQSCQQKYDLNSYRKNTILKLRSYLTEVMLDQIPILGEMQRYLEHLSMMDPPAPKSDFILEQIPEMRDKILHDYDGKWKQIAKKQSKTHFNPSDSEMRAQAKRWADTYNFEMLENLISDPPKCAMCGAEASKRCSRCQNEWYCRRECQVKHWPKHKQACNLVYESLEKVKQQKEKQPS